MSRFPFIAAGLTLIAVGVIVLVVGVVHSQEHLRSVQRELDRANEQIVQSKRANADLATSVAKLETEVDEANKARTEIQGHLNDANSTIEQLRKKQLKENQTHAQELMSELEKDRKQADDQLTAEKEANRRQFETITDEATKKLSESEKRVADLTDQFKSVSAQVEQLKTEKDAAESKLIENQAEFEAIEKPGAVFATNTSTIPITDIAANAKHPENVVGMHFFNPVDRMPLVEVIRGAKSSEQALVTVANFARKLGKTVVYCNDGPGFVVNRILGPYMNESGFVLEEGNSIESVDKAMVDFGMPMGPAALLDEVGIDVAAKVAKILGGAFGDRMQPSGVVEKLYADGRHGKKNERGLYLYQGGKRQGPDPSVYKVLGIRSPKQADANAVVERMLLAMINEAALILDEHIVATAAELDLAMIMGTGFPPFRGGLLRYADALGTPYILARLDELSSRHGARFIATAPLRRLAERDGKFYDAYRRSSS